ncbi:MAG: tetratricopeptide repeat protein [Planctomycetota bacterium]|nr:tetratricopeptide repeat protein [Planctomycetota bacterium]
MSSSKSRRRPDAKATPSAAPAKAPVPRRKKLRGWRLWALRLGAVVLAPTLAILLLEVGLRLGDYGYPTAFFVKTGTPDLWRANERFGWRFFPRALARDPESITSAPKKTGAVRIFVLGSSAAQGVPDSAYSFGRILDVMLRQRYPDTKFEVINAAMTATNSHVAVEIARDCAGFEPDVFIVYSGNNEVIGPYGPGTVFESWQPARWMIRARSRLAAARVGQLLANTAAWFRPAAKGLTHWEGLAMFAKNPVPADDPRLATTYENYRRNLEAICGIARDAGATVVLSTLAVNLEDCPPMGSQHRSDLSADDLKRWEALYKEGTALESSGKGREAMAQFQAAEKIDNRYAELPFRMGRCLASLGERAAARERFAKARDLDVMRFRADSRENAIVREVAAGAGEGVALADAEEALAACGIPDSDLLYEHVHFTFEGNYQVARALLEPVCQSLTKRLGMPLPGETAVPDKAFCAERLACTPWDELTMAQSMIQITSGPPFTNQLDFAARLARQQDRIAALRRLATTPEAFQAAYKTYEAALAQSGGDRQLREHFADVAMQCGRPQEAIRQRRKVVEEIPWAVWPKVALGRALLEANKLDDAIGYLEQALKLKPDFAPAHSLLGTALASKGKTQEALAHMEESLRLDPGNGTVHDNIAFILAAQGRAAEAFRHYEQAVQVDPGNADVVFKFADVLDDQGKAAQAIERYEQGLRIDPDNAPARYRLATAYFATGDSARAAGQYTEALRLAPDMLPALNNLAYLRATSTDPSLRDGAQAVRLASRACQITERKRPRPLATLAAAYAEAGQFPLALQAAEEALALAGNQGPMADDIRRKLAVYKSGQPVREAPPAPATKP